MAFKTSRTFTSRGRPPRLAGGIAGSTSAHSASVKSLGYRKPRRFAARRCSGVHIEHPLASIRVLDNESHPIPPTQQLLGSALSALGNCRGDQPEAVPIDQRSSASLVPVQMTKPPPR